MNFYSFFSNIQRKNSPNLHFPYQKSYFVEFYQQEKRRSGPALLSWKNLYRIMLETDGVRKMLKHFMRWHCERKLSGLDDYSWTKERAVRRYVKQSSNYKNIECTFAASESRREFIKMKSEQEGQACNPRCVNKQLVGILFCISNLNSSVLKDIF